MYWMYCLFYVLNLTFLSGRTSTVPRHSESLNMNILKCIRIRWVDDIFVYNVVVHNVVVSNLT